MSKTQKCTIREVYGVKLPIQNAVRKKPLDIFLLTRDFCILTNHCFYILLMDLRKILIDNYLSCRSNIVRLLYNI